MINEENKGQIDNENIWYIVAPLQFNLKLAKLENLGIHAQLVPHLKYENWCYLLCFYFS